jgi:hypothetical protein
MTKTSRKHAEWLWKELQILSDSADRTEVDPLITVWAYLRFSLWLNFDRAPNLPFGKAVATQVMADSIAAAQQDITDAAHYVAPKLSAGLSHNIVKLR